MAFLGFKNHWTTAKIATASAVTAWALLTIKAAANGAPLLNPTLKLHADAEPLKTVMPCGLTPGSPDPT